MSLSPSQTVTSPSAASLDHWDRQHSWHPFTQMSEYFQMPQLHVERGDGCWLYDVEGNRYLDGNASIWTNVHGHNDPDLNQVLKEQVDRVAHSTYLGLSHPAGAELGRRLVDMAPEGLDRVTFSDNGSTAIEIALKQSFQYWQLRGMPEKRLVVCLENGYHGDTFGAMSAGDSRSFHGRFSNWGFENRVFKSPLCREFGGEILESDMSESLADLEVTLRSEGDQVACVILEPSIQGAAGMRLQPKGFLQAVKELCVQYNTHLILDEIFVGCGRTGSLLVCAEEGVCPDFLCLAKGLTAGYLPLAATLTSECIFEAFLGQFDSGNAFFHGHTFTGNPLAAVVALKNLEKLENLKVSSRLDQTIHVFGNVLQRYFADHSNVREIRQRGMAAAIDLQPSSNQATPWKLNDRHGLTVCLQARKRGLLLRPLLDSILIVPPLVISEEEIDFLMSRLKQSIDETLN